jgi:hypothetical protein
VTEAEWLAARRVVELDLYRGAKGRHRKWRLFAVACARQALALAPDPRLDALADAAEQFADGALSWEEVKRSRRVLPRVRKELSGGPFGPHEVKYKVLHALDRASRRDAVKTFRAAEHARYAFAALSRPDWDAGHQRAEGLHVALARDIFENPFRKVAFKAMWRTHTTLGVATRIYEGREFSAMPILADALEDAGCTDVDILPHLRSPGPHARGCWALDLILGKD